MSKRVFLFNAKTKLKHKIMKTLNFFSKKIELLKNLKTKFKKRTAPKTESNTLLKQMYSDENETLFI